MRWSGVTASSAMAMRCCSRQCPACVTEKRKTPGSLRRQGFVGRVLALLLLVAENSVLQALREAELAHALGRDLDRFAGLRIAAHPSLAVREHQLAETGKHETVLGFLRGERERGVEHFADLLLAESGLLGEVGVGL